jgi:hypothetical protein
VPEIVCSVPDSEYKDIPGVLEVLADNLEPIIFAEELEARRLKEFQVAAELIRQTRNTLLAQTDIYTLPDYPISSEKRAEWLAYRQLLRDITNQETFPNNVTWPIPPTKE